MEAVVVGGTGKTPLGTITAVILSGDDPRIFKMAARKSL